MKISIVIPAFNEENRIKKTIEHILTTFAEEGWGDENYEIIVVDDGSTDRTNEIVREMQKECTALKLIRNYKNFGKGKALQRGVAIACGNVIVIYDADAATPAKYIAAYAPLIEKQEYDVIIGSRELGLREGYKVTYYRSRRLSGRIFAFLTHLVISSYLDTQCGFKLFSRHAAHHLFSLLLQKGYVWDIELLSLAQHFQYKVKEVPVEWYHQPGSKVNLFKDAIIMVSQLFQIKLRLRQISKEKWIKGIHCIICSGNYWKEIKTIDKWTIVKCGICGLAITHPMLSPEDLAQFYNQDYFVKGLKSAGYHDYLVWKKCIEKTSLKRLELIRKFVPQPGNLLEIGCATGYFLNMAQKEGWKITGVEISDWAAALARQQLGHDTIIHAPIEEALHSLKNKKFDVIIAWDVLEHIIEPQKLLPLLGDLLATNGILAITTPDTEGLLAKMTGKHWINYDKVPEHVYFFGKTNLCQLFDQKDFTILKAVSHGKHAPIGFLLGRFLEIFFIKVPALKENNVLNQFGLYCNPTDITLLICQNKRKQNLPAL